MLNRGLAKYVLHLLTRMRDEWSNTFTANDLLPHTTGAYPHASHTEVQAALNYLVAQRVLMREGSGLQCFFRFADKAPAEPQTNEATLIDEALNALVKVEAALNGMRGTAEKLAKLRALIAGAGI